MRLYTPEPIETIGMRYEVVSVVEPLPIDVEEVCDYLNLCDASINQRVEVERIIKAVIEMLEGYLLHSIQKKMIKLSFDTYTEAILPAYDPYISVDAVTGDGNAFILDTDYSLIGAARKRFAFNSYGNDLLIEATVGYEPGEVPHDLLLAIKREVAVHYDGEGKTLSRDTREMIGRYNRSLWL